MTKQGDKKLNIPAKNKIELWENGIIKKCTCSNEITVKMKTYQYTNNADIPGDTICCFNKDGTIRAVLLKDRSKGLYADTFYEDGSIKCEVEIGYNNNVFSVKFFNPKGILVEGFERNNYLVYQEDDWPKFYLKGEDKCKDVAMVFFDVSGKPSSYSVFKKDDNGNILTDVFGFPLCEEEKKKLLNQEEKNEEEKKKRSK